MKGTVCSIGLCLSILCSADDGCSQDMSASAGTAALLRMPLSAREAVIWHTGQDGFVIRTKSHLLIFDYSRGGSGKGPGSLAEGLVDPEEIKDFDVVVFVTHCDGDHFNRSVFEWKHARGRITYVLGFEPQMALEKYIHIQPWQEQRVTDMEVLVAPAIDSGEAYLVKVDGLVICHMGDHGYVMDEAREPVAKAVEWFASKARPIDLLFMNGEPYSNPARGFFHPHLYDGIYMATEKLAPRAVFPMHGAVEETIARILRLAPSDEARSNIQPKLVLLNQPGEVVVYRDGQIANR